MGRLCNVKSSNFTNIVFCTFSLLIYLCNVYAALFSLWIVCLFSFLFMFSCQHDCKYMMFPADCLCSRHCERKLYRNRDEGCNQSHIAPSANLCMLHDSFLCTPAIFVLVRVCCLCNQCCGQIFRPAPGFSRNLLCNEMRDLTIHFVRRIIS